MQIDHLRDSTQNRTSWDIIKFFSFAKSPRIPLWVCCFVLFSPVIHEGNRISDWCGFLILNGSMWEKDYSNHLIFGKQSIIWKISVSMCVYGEQGVKPHRAYLVCAGEEGGEEGHSFSLVYPYNSCIFPLQESHQRSYTWWSLIKKLLVKQNVSFPNEILR